MPIINPTAEDALTAILSDAQADIARLYQEAWSSLAEASHWPAWVQEYASQGGLPLSTDTLLDLHLSAAIEGDIHERLLEAANAGAQLIIGNLEAKAFEGIRDALRATMQDKIAPKVQHYVDQQRMSLDRIAREVTQRAPQTLTRAVQAVRQSIGLTGRNAQGWLRRHRAAISGDILPDVALSITEEWSRGQRATRAQRIGRTETVDAFNAGQVAAVDVGFIDGIISEKPVKVWLTDADSRVCKICKPLHGESVGFDEMFDTLAGFKDYPPAHTDCRCTILFRE